MRVLTACTESMCKVRSHEVKAVFHVRTIFGIFIEGFKEINAKILLNLFFVL